MKTHAVRLFVVFVRGEAVEDLLNHMHVSDHERQRLINTRIDPALMPVILDFLYKEENCDSVPPQMYMLQIPRHIIQVHCCHGVITHCWKSGKGLILFAASEAA